MNKFYLIMKSKGGMPWYLTKTGKWSSRDTVERASFTNEEATDCIDAWQMKGYNEPLFTFIKEPIR